MSFFHDTHFDGQNEAMTVYVDDAVMHLEAVTNGQLVDCNCRLI